MYQCERCRAVFYTYSDKCPQCGVGFGGTRGVYDLLPSFVEEEREKRRQRLRKKLLEAFAWTALFGSLGYFAYCGINRYMRIHGAAERGDVAALVQIFSEGYDVNYEFGDNFGGTPLTVAAKNGRTAAVEMLLRLGANPNAQDKQTLTALMHAVKNGDLEMIKILRNANADPQLKDYWGQTAFDFARQNGNHEALRLLEQPQ